MKKPSLISIALILILLTSCNKITTKNNYNSVQYVKAVVNQNYVGSEYRGNYVWGGAMNLAWNELSDKVIKAKISLATKDKKALEIVDKFNNPVFSKKDLDEKSYYIKSGYGQKTVDAINKESKKKFPDKTFSDLHITLAPKGIIAYAYFLKILKYPTVFEKGDTSFKGEDVKGFYAVNPGEKENIGIIKYVSDNKFIISIKLKNHGDELILAKGYDMAGPRAVVAAINKYNQGEPAAIAPSDSFEAPILHLDHHRDYIELINKDLANQGFEDYYIKRMFENIKFDMDEKGARAESEAVITAQLGTAPFEPDDAKHFTLNKPFWVIMKKKALRNPYLILGVRNSKVMEVSEKSG